MIGGVRYLTGVVSAIDPKAATARVRFDELDGFESAFIPVGQRKTHRDKDYWMVDVGDQVACLMDEHAEDGVILCSIYSGADKPPVTSKDKRHVRFEDGTTVEYDRSTGALAVNCVGSIRLQAAGDIDIEAAGQVRVRGATIHLNEG